ncbi:ABC transporter ATP-binding protein [Pacificibacter marinus]|uniref:Oligopeptide transport ATP-binding protein OppF n=1 Tax=Pacificibacter marinus TaxID=658057 RepID=A0A1Y5T8H4_9RHOB|nr:oligopeptide/dipeptide ABC transporter ATP-binding protein [Pacificibacter marinus]SEL08862.1 peptide/nickel transport system ATP-binding protein [Pacificibacter marinus]SLN58258.1 Oligopeptide transport ATP-binding protein OppF [Pacificibacter marinus]
MIKTPILEVENLSKHFEVQTGIFKRETKIVKAATDLNFHISEGETLALVGESGCGKTTTTRLLLKLQTPTAGRVLYDGQDINTLNGQGLKTYRSKVQAVFQDPWSSINPRVRIGDFIAEPLIVNEKVDSNEVDRRVNAALDAVGLRRQDARKFPHEFSGGQRQRIAIASAIITRPRLVILDEPVSGLDVSIRSQIINLFKDLQAEYALSYILVAHDLATTRYLADRVAVMYLGQMVEQGNTDDVFDAPAHPYTEALLSAALSADPTEKRTEIPMTGEVPSPLNPPSGCAFHPRCHKCIGDICKTQSPVPFLQDPNRTVSCHLYDQ